MNAYCPCSSVIVDAAVRLENGRDDTTFGQLVVHSRYTRGADFALERHLVYGSGLFLVTHGPNLVADLQNLCWLLAKFCVNTLQWRKDRFAGNNPSYKRGSLFEFPKSKL